MIQGQGTSALNKEPVWARVRRPSTKGHTPLRAGGGDMLRDLSFRLSGNRVK